MTAQQQEFAKVIIQMSGAPGSGKSTIAKLLRAPIRGVVIDHDVLRSTLLESQIINFNQAAKQAYQLQWALARDMMEQNLNVIIDSPCNYPEALEHGSTLAIRYGYSYWYIECKINDIDLLDQRLRSRNAMTSQRTAVDCPPAAAQETRAGEDAYALFQNWIKTPCRPDDNVIVLDSTSRPEMLRDQALERIFSKLQNQNEG